MNHLKEELLSEITNIKIPEDISGDIDKMKTFYLNEFNK